MYRKGKEKRKPRLELLHVLPIRANNQKRRTPSPCLRGPIGGSACSVLLLHVRIGACQDFCVWNIALWRGRPWCGSDDVAILVHELKVVSTEKMGNCRKLWAVSGSVVVEFE